MGVLTCGHTRFTRRRQNDGMKMSRMLVPALVGPVLAVLLVMIVCGTIVVVATVAFVLWLILRWWRPREVRGVRACDQKAAK